MYLGAKIGFLGPNGAGKSSLMKILAGVDKSFDGDYYLDPNIRIGYLAQVQPYISGLSLPLFTKMWRSYNFHLL